MKMGWHGLYKEQWQGAITPEAFSHPAKVSRGLARKIYAYAIEQGWLKPGDTCLDPFAGIGGFALDALANGLNFVGVELEQNFVDMGAGCDCTGISEADWVACFGRWKRFAHKDGRHWCPRCLAEAEGVIEPRPPSLPGMEPEPTASYQRNSGKIPRTEPHRYTGNLDLFAKHAKNGATAVLVQGDSRNLIEVLEGARMEGIISSPPYSKSLRGNVKTVDENRLKRMEDAGYHDRRQHGFLRGKHSRTISGNYSTDPAQLGNMPTGEPPQAIVSSPPLGKAQGGGTSFWEGLEERHDRKFSDKVREGSQGYREDQLGDSEGQLGTMPTGEPPQVDGLVSSPPFADSQQARRGDFVLRSTKVNPTPRKLADRSYFPAEMESDGQLAALPEGEPPQIDGLVSSPPHECTRTIPSDDESEAARGYGNSTGKERTQDAQNTFWSAARAILLQCHQVLAPGGVAIFVTKRFVRNKQIVEFSQQWADLCQSCGFELVEWIKAWLVEERGTQYDLEGEAHTKIIKRFSFFRRLHAQKYPNLAIEWEDVLIFRKGRNHVRRDTS